MLGGKPGGLPATLNSVYTWLRSQPAKRRASPELANYEELTPRDLGYTALLSVVTSLPSAPWLVC